MYLQNRRQHKNELPKGRQTLADLEKHNSSLANIEITGENIRSFSRVAKKYKIDYALKRVRNKNPPLYYVFFKGRDEERISVAFSEYSQNILNRKQKPSIPKTLKKMTELTKQNTLHKKREKAKDRGMEL